MGDNDWVLWYGDAEAGIVLRTSYTDRRKNTVDMDAGLAFDTRAEAEAIANSPGLAGGGFPSQRGWVKDLAADEDSLDVAPFTKRQARTRRAR